MKKNRNKTADDLVSAFQQAVSCLQQGDLGTAETFARKALELDRDNANIHFLLGIIAGRIGDYNKAANLISSAIKADPGNPEYYFNLGFACQCGGHPEKALAAYDKAVQLRPDHATTHFNRGNVLRNLNRTGDALSACETAISINPGIAETHTLRGNLLRESGQLDAAIAACEQALLLDQNSTETYVVKGIALLDTGRLDEGLACCEQAIRLNPELTDSHVVRGMILRSQGHLEAAVSAYKKAIDLNPDLTDAHVLLGNALCEQGRTEAADTSFYRAIELNPGSVEAHNSQLFTANYNPDLSPEKVFELHHRWGRNTASSAREPTNQSNHVARDRERRLRIGYLSPDFRTHSVAFFFEPLLCAHHNDAVEIYCYSNVKCADETTERIKARADHWISIRGMPDAAVVDRIQRDHIDILVDLAGHSSGNRLAVFARRPAPIQVTWLGYPNTTGLPVMDYRLTDAIADPAGHADQLHTETLVRLENGFLCYQPPDTAPAVAEAPSTHSGHITFGSFNNLPKVNNSVIALWSEILLALPGSRLLLKSKALSDAGTRQRYLKLFERHGVSSQHVDLHGKLPRQEDHLGFYSRVDIGLDPFPYNGTTTTCEALWMGVPVVTLAGDRHAARVGASILERTGFENQVAATPASYIDIALRLAKDKAELAKTRRGLRDRMKNSPLCNAEAFAHEVENIYREMWQYYLEKQ